MNYFRLRHRASRATPFRRHDTARYSRVPNRTPLISAFSTLQLYRLQRCCLLPDEGLPDVAPNIVLTEFASNGVILVRKK